MNRQGVNIEKRIKTLNLNKNEKTILIVDDNEDLREVLIEMIESLGYKTLTAESPLQALEIFTAENQVIDLILSDIVMPDGGGPELADKLMQLSPDIKMIFMSGFAEDEIVHDDVFKIQHSQAMFIKKPFTREEIGSLLLKQFER